MRQDKILFLDIDGPMIPQRAYVLPGNKFGKGTVKCFDPIAVEMINELLDLSKAKLVISSAWAEVYKKKELVEILKSNGLVFKLHKDWMTPRRLTSGRENEIAEWLIDHEGTYSHSVIIDDAWISDDFIERWRNVIKVDFHDGITWKNFQDALTLLGHTNAELIAHVKKRKREHYAGLAADRRDNMGPREGDPGWSAAVRSGILPNSGPDNGGPVGGGEG